MVRGSVEETLNELLEKAAESLTQAARYERNLTTTSGNITLHMPRLKGGQKVKQVQHLNYGTLRQASASRVIFWGEN